MKFRPMIQYPIDLLKALLTVFRTQSFSNGSRLSWNSWLEACRRPSELIQVVSECASCGITRAFVPRVLWAAPKELPAWTCDCFGTSCQDREPEVITEAATGVWRLLVAQDKRGGSEVSHAQKSGISRLEASEAKVRLSEQFGNSDLHRTNREKQFGNSDLHRVTEEIWPSASSAQIRAENFAKNRNFRVEELQEPQIDPADSVSNISISPKGRSKSVAWKSPGMATTKYTWTQRRIPENDAILAQELSRYIVGLPLRKFVSADPSDTQVQEFERILRSPEGNYL